MDEKEARALEQWDRVTWKGDPADLGTVTEISDVAFYVKWDGSHWGWIHFEDAQDVGMACQAEQDAWMAGEPRMCAKYDVYVKKFSESFAGRGAFHAVAEGGKIVAHVKRYEDPTVSFEWAPTLVGKPVSELGEGWSQLTGFALENAQGFAQDCVDAGWGR